MIGAFFVVVSLIGFGILAAAAAITDFLDNQ